MRRPLARALVALVALATLACSTTPAAKPAAAPATSAPAAANAPAAQPSAPPARAKIEYMMIVPIVSYWQQYVAQEQGFFDRQGIDIEFTYTDSSSKVVQGLASGSVNLGSPSPDAVINAVEHGSPL